jgi:hypothetical protein
VAAPSTHVNPGCYHSAKGPYNGNHRRFEFEKIPSATAQTEQQKKLLPGSTRFDWIVTILCTLLIGGVFLDGWAHNHGKVDNTFFTPWHAVLYSGYALGAAFLFFSLARNHAKGYPWREALPAGYGLSLLGAIIFGIGGVLDEC